MMKAISDFMGADELRSLATFIPTNRQEYLKINQLSYNLKLNTNVPHTVHIEPTNKCNQTCVMCVHPDMQRTVGFIPDEIAYKAIDECADSGVYAVHFFFFGEPFMNRQTIEYIAYAKKKKIPLVSVTTNLTTIKKSEIERMVTDGLDSVHISFEGLNRERYADIRGTDSFDKVIKNLDHLRECKQKHGRENPWISMTYVRTSETDEEIELFKNLWKDKVNTFHISPQFDYIGRAKIRENQDEVNSEGIMVRNEEGRLPCRQLWHRLVVLSNGELVPCSQNIDGELSVGNIKDMTISEAWQGEKMAELRMQHLVNRIPKNCVCSKCIDWDWGSKVDSRKELGRTGLQEVLNIPEE